MHDYAKKLSFRQRKDDAKDSVPRKNQNAMTRILPSFRHASLTSPFRRHFRKTCLNSAPDERSSRRRSRTVWKIGQRSPFRRTGASSSRPFVRASGNFLPIIDAPLLAARLPAKRRLSFSPCPATPRDLDAAEPEGAATPAALGARLRADVSDASLSSEKDDEAPVLRFLKEAAEADDYSDITDATAPAVASSNESNSPIAASRRCLNERALLNLYDAVGSENVHIRDFAVNGVVDRPVLGSSPHFWSGVGGRWSPTGRAVSLRNIGHVSGSYSRNASSVSLSPRQDQLAVQCGICGKIYVRTWHLANHMRIHDGRVFRCNFPGCRSTKGYLTCGSLDRHKRLKHDSVNWRNHEERVRRGELCSVKRREMKDEQNPRRCYSDSWFHFPPFDYAPGGVSQPAPSRVSPPPLPPPASSPFLVHLGNAGRNSAASVVSTSPTVSSVPFSTVLMPSSPFGIAPLFTTEQHPLTLHDETPPIFERPYSPSVFSNVATDVVVSTSDGVAGVDSSIACQNLDPDFEDLAGSAQSWIGNSVAERFFAAHSGGSGVVPDEKQNAPLPDLPFGSWIAGAESSASGHSNNNNNNPLFFLKNATINIV